MINMKGRITIIGIIAILMLVTPLTAVAGTLKTSDETCEYVVETTEENLVQLVDFFNNECPEDVPALEDALEKAIIEDENGVVTAIDLLVLEEELEKSTIGGKRTRLRFFRIKYIEAEYGTYENTRNPYDRWYWPGKYAIRWAFISSDYKIKCYNDWTLNDKNEPVPVGSPSFYCRKVWFHDWASTPIWAWETHKLGGAVYNMFALGRTSENVNRQYFTNPLFMRLIEHFPLLAKLLGL